MTGGDCFSFLLRTHVVGRGNDLDEVFKMGDCTAEKPADSGWAVKVGLPGTVDDADGDRTEGSQRDGETRRKADMVGMKSRPLL